MYLLPRLVEELRLKGARKVVAQIVRRPCLHRGTEDPIAGGMQAALTVWDEESFLQRSHAVELACRARPSPIMPSMVYVVRAPANDSILDLRPAQRPAALHYAGPAHNI